MKFNIIGAGRLGKNLALALVARGDGQLVAICNHSLNSGMKAVAELGSGTAVASLAELPAVDVIFITTPDDCIAAIASTLTCSNTLVVHCSGVLSSEILATLKKRGCLIASIHPLKAFRENYLQCDAFQGCDCMIEGDDEAVRLLTVLFSALGAQVMSINATKKNSYHAAAVMASNYVVTLAGCAIELLIEAGLSESQAKNMTQGLMRSSLTNIESTSHIAAALTGPLSRGDVSTVDKHLQAIQQPHISALYRAAALATLPLTNLDEKTICALRERLDEC